MQGRDSGSEIMPASLLDAALARRMAASTFGNLDRAYSHMMMHGLAGLAGLRAPEEICPLFYTSYDWHSCIRGWWQVMRIARPYPQLDLSETILAKAGATFLPEKASAEIGNFDRPVAAGFERPCGWAWLLALHGELRLATDPRPPKAMAPLAQLFASRQRSPHRPSRRTQSQPRLVLEGTGLAGLRGRACRRRGIGASSRQPLASFRRLHGRTLAFELRSYRFDGIAQRLQCGMMLRHSF